MVLTIIEESPATLTRDYILTLDNALTIYIARFQDNPDNCLCIYDTGGGSNDSDTGRPTISIHCRDVAYKKARGLLEAIKLELDKVTSNGKIVGYEVLGDINNYKIDESKRYYFSLNLIVYTEKI